MKYIVKTLETLQKNMRTFERKVCGDIYEAVKVSLIVSSGSTRVRVFTNVDTTVGEYIDMAMDGLYFEYNPPWMSPTNLFKQRIKESVFKHLGELSND